MHPQDCINRKNDVSLLHQLCKFIYWPSGTGKKGGGNKEGPPALAGTREYEQSDR